MFQGKIAGITTDVILCRRLPKCPICSQHADLSGPSCIYITNMHTELTFTLQFLRGLINYGSNMKNSHCLNKQTVESPLV